MQRIIPALLSLALAVLHALASVLFFLEGDSMGAGAQGIGALVWLALAIWRAGHNPSTPKQIGRAIL